METHILRPSPYFQGQFETQEKKPRNVGIRNNLIEPMEGFKHIQGVKVIFEELFYNKKYQPFRVLCIERILDTASTTYVVVDAPENEYIIPKTSLAQHLSFISLFAGEDMLETILVDLRKFKETYVIVDGYANDAVRKIDDMCSRLISVLFSRNVKLVAFRDDPRVVNSFRDSIECFVLDHLYDRIYAAVLTANKAEIKKFNLQLERFASFTPEKIGVNRDFICDLRNAITELNMLTSLRTPFEMHLCLKRTLEEITSHVHAHLNATKPGVFVALATDDLLPLLALVIIRANIVVYTCMFVIFILRYVHPCTMILDPRHPNYYSYCLFFLYIFITAIYLYLYIVNIFLLQTLSSLLQYMEQFGMTLCSLSDYTYNIITLQAAVQYIMEGSFVKEGSTVSDSAPCSWATVRVTPVEVLSAKKEVGKGDVGDFLTRLALGL